MPYPLESLAYWIALIIQTASVVALSICARGIGVATRRNPPQLLVYFANPASLFAEIVIENFGDDAVAEVMLEFDPPLRTSKGDDSAARFFETQKTLPPHGRMLHALDSWADYFLAECPRRYDVTIRYRKLGDPAMVEQHCVLDAGMHEHQHAWRARGLPELAGAFEQFTRRTEQSLRETDVERRSHWLVHGLEADERTFGHAMAAVLAILQLLASVESTKEIALPMHQILPALRRAVLTALVAASVEPMGSAYREPLGNLLLITYHRAWNFVDEREAHDALRTAAEAIRDVWCAEHESQCCAGRTARAASA